jgi:hypothetical protein
MQYPLLKTAGRQTDNPAPPSRVNGFFTTQAHFTTATPKYEVILTNLTLSILAEAMFQDFWT